MGAGVDSTAGCSVASVVVGASAVCDAEAVVGVAVSVVEVCAPPELLTVTSGVPGADTVVDVSEGEVCAVAVVSETALDSEVSAPPELETVTCGLSEADPACDGDADSVAVVDVSVDGFSAVDVSEAELDVEEESAGSADAMADWPTTAAPTPSAAASSPTRPMNRA